MQKIRIGIAAALVAIGTILAAAGVSSHQQAKVTAEPVPCCAAPMR
jgi:hypothetical protein